MIGLIFQPEHLSFYGGLGLGTALTTVMIPSDAPPNHIERWREGADGEKATARALRPLIRAGWIIIHDVDRSRGNIDHISSAPRASSRDSKRLRGLCSFKRGVLTVRWREEPDDGYACRRLAPRAWATAAELSRKLQTDDALRHEVQPAVVLWADFQQTSVKSGGVAWIAGSHLAEVLRRRPVLLTPEQVQSVAHALRDHRGAVSLARVLGSAGARAGAEDCRISSLSGSPVSNGRPSRFCLEAASWNARDLGLEPRLRTPALTTLGLCLAALATASWAASAAYLLDGAENYVSDGFCFEGDSSRYAQAAVAGLGVAFAVTSITVGVRTLTARTTRMRSAKALGGAAAAVSVAWLVLVIVVVAPFSFADPVETLPAVYCTYENDPFR